MSANAFYVQAIASLPQDEIGTIGLNVTPAVATREDKPPSRRRVVRDQQRSQLFSQQPAANPAGIAGAYKKPIVDQP